MNMMMQFFELDDRRAVQPYSPTNDIDPTPDYLSQFAMDSISAKFPYLAQKKLKEGQEVRRLAQVDWKIIEEDCAKPFVASGLSFVPLPVTSPSFSFTCYFKRQGWIIVSSYPGYII